MLPTGNLMSFTEPQGEQTVCTLGIDRRKAAGVRVVTKGFWEEALSEVGGGG